MFITKKRYAELERVESEYEALIYNTRLTMLATCNQIERNIEWAQTTMQLAADELMDLRHQLESLSKN